MDDTTNLNPPAVLRDLLAVTQTMGFGLSSDALTGSLLRTLAASKPAGQLLELGTGTGAGACWLLDGMDAASRLHTVDVDEANVAVARQFLGNDKRITWWDAKADMGARLAEIGVIERIEQLRAELQPLPLRIAKFLNSE